MVNFFVVKVVRGARQKLLRDVATDSAILNEVEARWGAAVDDCRRVVGVGYIPRPK